MDLFSAVILGVVQGATEFIPVSSTGHLILMRSVLGIEGDDGLAFDAILHLATAGAVIVYYLDELWLLLQSALRKLGRLPVNERDLILIKALLAGTIPAVILGLLLERTMETFFRQPLLVAGVLVLGSALFILAEYRYQNTPSRGDVDVKTGLKIGLFQTLALIPGMSRSGASISGGMLLGLTRSEATRFAFLLSVPVILGAGMKKFLELISSDVVVDWVPVGVSALTAFVVGLIAIHFMITFLRTNTLWPFIWYRIILAGFVVFVVFFG
jgi:undecaprenyl-diphosphatase